MAGPHAPPTNDDALAVAAAQGTKDHENTSTPIVADLDGDRKAFLTLQARAAMLGFELLELGCSTYLLARWGMSREMSGLHTVSEALRQIGGRQ
jgi:hypothetical protein